MWLKPSASAPNSSFDSTGTRAAKSPSRHPPQAVLDLVHRPDDEQERQVDERQRADDRQRDQRELDRAQQRRRPRDVLLERADEGVDLADEALDARRGTAPAGLPPRRARAPASAPPIRGRTPRTARSIASVLGTNSGRPGSPWRKVATTSSNAAMSRVIAGPFPEGADVRASSSVRYARRYVRIRRLPASLIAAALPSSRQETTSVSPIEISATARKTTWMPTSLAESFWGGRRAGGMAGGIAVERRRRRTRTRETECRIRRVRGVDPRQDAASLPATTASIASP